MKIHLLIYCAIFITSKCYCRAPPLKDPVRAPVEIISLDDITPEQRKQIALVERKIDRKKRSGKGSGDFLIKVAGTIGKGIGTKVGQVALASATAGVAAVGAFSSASSKGKSGGTSKPAYHYYHHHHHPGAEDCHYDHGHQGYETKSFDWWSIKKSILNTILQAVKAIKGGVIAISGKLIQGGGKIISSSGNLVGYKGEKISQLGKNIATSAVLVPFGSKHPPSGPSGHGDHGSSAPSAPEVIYHAPSGGSDYHEHYPAHGHHHHDDVVVIKIPHHHHHESKVPPPAVAYTGPSYANILGKLFQSSSSSHPSKPADVDYVETPSAHSAPADHHVPDQPTQQTYYAGAPVSNSYGFFEQEPGYLQQHLDDYAVAASKDAPVAVKPNEHLQPPRNIITVPDSKKIAPGLHLDLPRPFGNQSSNYFVAMNITEATPTKDLSYLYDALNPTNKHPSSEPVSNSDPVQPLEGNFEYYGNVDLSGVPKFPDKPFLISADGLHENSPSPFLQVPKKVYFTPTPSNVLDLTPEHSDGFKSENYDVLRSVAYEIGPDGPKKLT